MICKLTHFSSQLGLYGLLLSLLLLSGCAENKYLFRYGMEEAPEVVWPDEGDTSHYRYVGELLGEQNFVRVDDGSFGEMVVDALKWVAGIFSKDGGQPVVLQRPQSGTVGPDGRVYVTDVSRQAVYVFDTVEGSLEVWSDTGTTGGFGAPVGVVVLPDGEVLVADAQLGAVIRFDSTGQSKGFFAAGIMERPTGLAYDVARDLLYIADSVAHDIKVFRRDGSFVKRMGQAGTGDGEFNSPTHLFFRNDRLYVSDTHNARVQVFDGEGNFLRKFGERGLYVGNMPRPKGVAVDSDDNVYVVESYFDHLLIFDDEAQFLLPIGGAGFQIGQFYLPAGVWVDDADRVYVADMYNGRVSIFQYLGEDGEARVPSESTTASQ